MHRQDALERQPVVHQSEDPLLDFAGVEVPPISTSLRDGCSTTNVPVRVPSSSGVASTWGACRTSASTEKRWSSRGVGTMNIVFAKSA